MGCSRFPFGFAIIHQGWNFDEEQEEFFELNGSEIRDKNLLGYININPKRLGFLFDSCKFTAQHLFPPRVRVDDATTE